MSFSKLTRASALPTAFKCAADGQWHEPDQFSERQLGKWFQKKQSINDGVTPENMGLLCKIHARDLPLLQEIKCHGPCSAWKYKEQFSKTQRKEPEPWCKICTAWTTQFDGGEIPLPPPSSKLSPDEIFAQEAMLQEGMPEVPVRGHEIRSLTGFSASTIAGSRSYAKHGALLGITYSMSQGVARRTKQSDETNDGLADAPSPLNHTEDETTSVQQSTARTVSSDESGSQEATNSGAWRKPVLSNDDTSLAPLNSSTDEETAVDEEGSRMKPDLYSGPSRRWVKGDNRKVFQLLPIYAPTPTDKANTDDPEWSSDEN
ncbi:hypothetical protein GGR52DRAFT_29328 [Hypoxylon sp. FL1284]|nr:hypothetical protein GGR52DRAFT_29328 [Hypoxylon sp. FL1284]